MGCIVSIRSYTREYCLYKALGTDGGYNEKEPSLEYRTGVISAVSSLSLIFVYRASIHSPFNLNRCPGVGIHLFRFLS